MHEYGIGGRRKAGIQGFFERWRRNRTDRLAERLRRALERDKPTDPEQSQTARVLCRSLDSFLGKAAAGSPHTGRVTGRAHAALGAVRAPAETTGSVMRTSSERSAAEQRPKPASHEDGGPQQASHATTPVDSLKAQLRHAGNEAVRLRMELQSTADRLQAVEDAAAQHLAEVDRLKRELLDLRTEHAEAVGTYNAIFEALCQCPSMYRLVRDSGLPTGRPLSVAESVQFANFFSNELSFARRVYDDMLEFKEHEPEPLTVQEKALVSHMNDYYRRTYGLDFDVLDCSIGVRLERGEDVRFDFADMQVNGAPSRIDVPIVTGLCVPLLRDADGERLEKAVIQEI